MMARGKTGMSLHRALAGLFASWLLCGCSLNGGTDGSALSSLETNKMGPPAITGPTLQQYIAYQQGAQAIAQGKMTLDGRPVSCGARPTVIDAKLDSWGGSYPGYLIVNPDRLRGLATPVKFYVYYHECGHQFVGASEVGADCFSIRRGVTYGWLNAKGMDQVCAFISQLKGDAVHPPGPRRCELMRQCYAMALHDKAQAHN
jgi:hypothetical protein